MSLEELLPCPFCPLPQIGNLQVWDDVMFSNRVYRVECGICGTRSRRYGSSEGARAAWNARPIAESRDSLHASFMRRAADTIGELQELVHALQGDVFAAYQKLGDAQSLRESLSKENQRLFQELSEFHLVPGCTVTYTKGIEIHREDSRHTITEVQGHEPYPH